MILKTYKKSKLRNEIRRRGREGERERGREGERERKGRWRKEKGEGKTEKEKNRDSEQTIYRAKKITRKSD